MSAVDRLESAVAATTYQRQWFEDLTSRVRGGADFVLANADAPHEIFRAMGLDYVVNQWWASVISAKRLSAPSLAALAAGGLPDFSRQYDTIPLGAQDLPARTAAWGGLPDPAFVVAERGGDVTHKIFEQWGNRPSTEMFLLNRTAAVPAPAGWWNHVAHDWESVFGRERIDLLAAEIAALADWLAERTGVALDLGRLTEILRLANEQAEWNRRTRDLLAHTRPLPVDVTDVIPAVMIPQWHRGSEWGVAAARRLYDEVEARVAGGTAVYAGERRRLMWIGRGLWSDLDTYRAFQDEHGAVFVWSMYLAIAADGYARYGDDPIRTLAARFVGLTDLLYVPPMSSSWYVKEATTHGVDGVVHLVADDTPGAAFITADLEAAGIPVLEIRANNADARSSGSARIRERIDGFLRERVRGAS